MNGVDGNNEIVKVLVIEDNPDDAVLITRMLQVGNRGSFEVHLKETLATGLKQLEKEHFDIILLDLMLPDSMGFPTFSKVQAAASFTPIIVMSGLSDESMAIRAVGKGAQDYLVKGQVDSNLLNRAIKYAIARKSGEKKKLTVEELKRFDGKDGRRAYIAYKGNVFDVTESPLWKTGPHGGIHISGKDLTADFGNAPHGEEVLARAVIVGELAGKALTPYRLLARLERLHPHPITVHFAIAYPIAVSLLSILYLATGNSFFESAAYYALIPGFFAALFAGFSGLLSWKIAYEEKITTIFYRKMVLTVLVIVLLFAALIWRTANPSILVDETALKYVYLATLLSLTPIIVVLGHDGGKIIHP